MEKKQRVCVEHLKCKSARRPLPLTAETTLSEHIGTVKFAARRNGFQTAAAFPLYPFHSNRLEPPYDKCVCVCVSDGEYKLYMSGTHTGAGNVCFQSTVESKPLSLLILIRPTMPGTEKKPEPLANASYYAALLSTD